MLPGLFIVAVRAGQFLARDFTPIRKAFITYSYTLVPLGLMAWVAFSLSFVLTNASYVWMALSDPFGWGWNLFGTAAQVWTPYLSLWLPSLQIVVLITGLVWSVRVVLKISTEKLNQRSALLLSLPLSVFHLAVTVALLGLLI